MFVDDSGNTRPHRASARGVGVHVLSGMIVHERGLHGARAAINATKRRLFAGPDPERVELHAYDVWNGRGEFSGAQSLNFEKKKEVFSTTVDAIAGSVATLISVVIWKNRLPSGMDGPRIRALSWGLLAERFEAYLNDAGGGDLGLVISDQSTRTNEEGIRAAFRVAKTRFGRHRGRRHLVMEDVFFKDSRREPLIQGADATAYIIQKQCHGDASFAGWFDDLKASMWKFRGRLQGFGIKDYPDPR